MDRSNEYEKKFVFMIVFPGLTIIKKNNFFDSIWRIVFQKQISFWLYLKNRFLNESNEFIIENTD